MGDLPALDYSQLGIWGTFLIALAIAAHYFIPKIVDVVKASREETREDKRTDAELKRLDDAELDQRIRDQLVKQDSLITELQKENRLRAVAERECWSENAKLQGRIAFLEGVAGKSLEQFNKHRDTQPPGAPNPPGLPPA